MGSSVSKCVRPTDHGAFASSWYIISARDLQEITDEDVLGKGRGRGRPHEDRKEEEFDEDGEYSPISSQRPMWITVVTVKSM